ncbi:MAG TPA: ATPase domain-containing protein [Acidimicrobiales bacterium]|nr:ATPase domain-containing protein [Acidimicrobiales bacterium]
MRTRALYTCRRCGTNTPRWQGRCGACDEWNSIDEVPTTSAPPSARVVTTSLREVADEDSAVTPSGVGELDRVLGGGFVAGSTTLLYGEPGVGKSTLALLTLRALAIAGADVLLVASEESAAQVAQRARRFGDVPGGLEVATSTNVHSTEALLRERRRTLCVVDSISAMSDDSLTSAVGSVPQVRNAAERLCAAAKASATALLLIGHVTKDGELAGPRALEHLVDTVVRIEGERQGTLRLLRAQKHRFGPTGEVGLFEMVGDGLHELTDASLSRRGAQLDVAGVVLTVTNDGTRSFLVEIQALVAHASGSTRRVAYQVSSQRLSLLLAVLESRCGVDTSALDVFAATAGGLAANEPGVDVALALAVASAVRGFAVAPTLVALGEVGLAGELRAVSGLTRRVREASRLGASVVIVPSEGDLDDVTGVTLIRCHTLAEAIDVARSSRGA